MVSHFQTGYHAGMVLSWRHSTMIVGGHKLSAQVDDTGRKLYLEIRFWVL